MAKIGVFVGERGLWTFFEDIYADLSAHYETEVFQYKDIQLPVLSARYNAWSYRNRMQSLLKKSDVCFFEWASELLEVATHLPKQAPIVTRMHSFELAGWAHRINWEQVDKIIFIGQAIRGKFIERYPEQAHKTVLIHNAIATNNFPPVDRSFDFSIGMLCTINPIKRVYEAILTIGELRQQGYSPTLHIAGGPNKNNPQDRYYLSVHRLVEKLDLAGHVKFYGHVNDPAAWLQKIDIFISNSYWEGMQTALIEAMATGCYSLAHFWDGAEEILPSENIYSTDSELKQKLISYADISESERAVHRKQMAEIARQRFDLEDKKAQIRQVIDSVL